MDPQRLTLSLMKQIIKQVGQALSYLDFVGVPHGRIDLRNVTIDQKCRVKIINFCIKWEQEC
jgi:serine/threonine protein kinase